jgi:hypothetical protein
MITGGLGDTSTPAAKGSISIPACSKAMTITGFTAGRDKLDLTQLIDGLGVAAGDRDRCVSITDPGFGAVDAAVDADGNKANGFELVVATVQTASPIASRPGTRW